MLSVSCIIFNCDENLKSAHLIAVYKTLAMYTSAGVDFGFFHQHVHFLYYGENMLFNGHINL